MASSQTGKSPGTIEHEAGEGVSIFSLGCGCLSFTKNGKLREIHWCPYHLAAHGNVIGAELGRSEQSRAHN